ncbi:MAG: NrsF family protein, partial [Caulobacteraceae bacterium]
ALESAHARGSDLATLWLGHAADNCALRIVVLSVPAFVAALWTIRRMAPTRPALAGAAAGFFAGAVAATVYGFFCTETSAAFVVAWYTLGIAVCAGFGALIGGRALRW